jgi:hypothetical protein
MKNRLHTALINSNRDVSLDSLHMEKVKAQQPARLKLAEVKAALAIT